MWPMPSTRREVFVGTITSAQQVSFSQAQKEANLSAQRQLAELLPAFDKAEECGCDMTGYRAIAAGLMEQLKAIQKNFMGPMQMGG